MATVDTEQQKRLARAKRLIQSMADRTTDKGFTEAETMEAASKIGALLAEFDLELDEVLARDVSDMAQQDVYAADYSMATVITGIGKLCSLVTYSRSGETVATYTFYGHKHDVELAVYLYEITSESCDVGWQAYMDKHGYSKKGRDSFRIGFGHRVYQRMADLRDLRDAEAARRAAEEAERNPNGTGTNLVVLKDQIVVAEFDKLGIKLTSQAGPKVHNRAAFSSGHAHGSTVNLERPLGGPAAKPALA